MTSISFRPGRLESSYQGALYLATAVAHFALILTGQLHPAHAVVIAVALAGAAFRPATIAAVPPLLWNIILVGVIVGSLATALAPPRNFETYFHGLTYLLIYTLTIRYFTRRQDRDDILILLLSLLEISAASIMTISISFLLSLVLYLVSAMSALMLLSLRREYRASLPPESDALKRSQTQDLHQSFFGYSFGTAVAVFAAGFVIFFLIPRMGRSLFSWSTGIHSRVSGFSDTVEMGSVGNLMQSEALVMRFSADPMPSPPHYLRGNALDHYDGRRWTDTAGIRRIRYFRYEETVELRPVTNLAETIKQEIVLEPIDSSVLFALPHAVAVQAPFKFRGILTYENDYFGYPLATPIFDRTIYNAWSVPPTPLEQACLAPPEKELPSRDGEIYLQLPSGTADISRLARQAAGDAQSPCEQAARVRDFLSRNYAYDLNTPSDQADDPVGDFLFNSRRGYCQHFATAMVLMLRSLGIPARLATGFLADEFNSVDRYYLVRESDAHTWAEMLAPNGEWVMVEPTPSSALLQQHNDGPFKWVKDMFDSLRFRWDRWVVDLNLRDQVQLAASFRQRGAMATRGVIGLPGRISALLRQPAAAVLVAALIIGIALWTRLSDRNRPTRERALSGLRREYRRLLRLAERKTRRRRESETLSEFAAAVSASRPDAARPFTAATAAYQRVRFGRMPVENQAVQAIQDARRALRQAPRTDR